MIILICGLSGCGKTTLAEIVSKKLNVLSISSDDLYPLMYPEGGARISTGDFTPEALKAVYACFGPLIYFLSIAASEKHLILSGNFRFHSQRESIKKVCEKLQMSLIVVLMTINNDDIVRERLKNRIITGEPGDYQHYLKTKAIFEFPSNAYLFDNSGTKEELSKKADQLITHIRESSPTSI